MECEPCGGSGSIFDLTTGQTILCPAAGHAFKRVHCATCCCVPGKVD